MKKMNIIKSKILIGAVIGLFPLMQSCEDDGDVVYIDPAYAYSDSQEAIAVSLCYDSYGLVANMNQASTDIQEISECGQMYYNNDTVYKESAPGYVSYEYKYAEDYMMSCEESSVAYNLTAEETLSAVRTDKNHIIAINFTITGLEEESNDEVYNGSYTRTGRWDAIYYEEDYEFTFDSKIDSVLLAKQSGKIYSGTVTFTLVQSYGPSNIDYTYHGTVEFLNEDEAKVVFDDGNEYTVNLYNISVGNKS